MRKRKCLVVLLVIIVILQEPSLLRAGRLNQERVRATGDYTEDQEAGEDGTYEISFYLNGGVWSKDMQRIYRQEDLPIVFEIPQKEGFNFAGWYTESGYINKLSGIDEAHIGNYQLFAKWTRCIDGDYNIQMYPYGNAAASGSGSRQLKNCTYRFLEDVEIPGMPSTREQDVQENRITDTRQCPQGICITDDYLMVSSYSGQGGSGLGCIHVFDRKTGAYCVSIGVKKRSHMGGIAFDGERIWVCHSESGTLGCIPYAVICRAAFGMPQSIVDCSASFEEYPVSNTPSCIAYYDGRIWVATHTKLLNSRMFAYRITDCGLELVESFRIPDKVQGVAFDEEGRVYVSTSYGRRNSSYLKVYESPERMNLKPAYPMVNIEMPPCSEEIELADGQLYVLFESAGEKYLEGTDGKGKSIAPVDKVLVLSLETFLQ